MRRAGRALLLAALLALPAGCSQMTNEQIVAEIARCKAAGLCSRQVVNGVTLRTVAVECHECPPAAPGGR
jgi:hypothetical protein